MDRNVYTMLNTTDFRHASRTFTNADDTAQAVEDPAAKKLREAAEGFESFFIEQMLKEARKVKDELGKDNPLHSQSTKLTDSLFDETLARTMSQQHSFGIADMLIKELSSQNLRLARSSGSDQPA